MSANMILQQQIDGLDVIRQLLSLDAKKVVSDQEAIRNQMQLTAEQEGRVAEAKSYIAKHASLVADLEGQRATFAAEKKEHETKVAQFNAYSEAETQRLNDLCTALGNKQIELDKLAKQHETNVQTLSGQRLDYEREHRNLLASCQKAEVDNNSAARANLAESERLKIWEATLKAKAQKIREQAADF